MSINKRLLPVGEHYGLTILKPRLRATGSFRTGSGHKLIWHTTESASGAGVERISYYLRAQRTEPHIVIDPDSGRCLQLIAFDQYAPTLRHPSGTPETNRANCIQIEICGFAKDSRTWPKHYYKHLAALAVLVEHRRPIPRRIGRAFSTRPDRLSPVGFILAAGHFGHQHVPNNDHWDPGALRTRTLLYYMRQFDDTPQGG